jgi:hypothetical protein
MATLLTASAALPPPHESAAFGALRVQVLDAALRGLPVAVPAGALDELAAWSGELLASARGPARGVDEASVPERWRGVLAWAGVPLVPAGELRWGVDLDEFPTQAVPERRDGRLALPPPETLEQLTSLALKPLRLFVAEHLACRLQAATGVHLYLWPNQAALVSCVSVPVGGFLYGPEVGQRHALSIAPGSCQVIAW